MPRVIHIPPGTNGGKQGLDDYRGAGGCIKNLLDEAIPFTGFEPVDPNILAKEALQGVAGACVRSIDPHTEADPVAVLINMIIGFGNLIHQGAHVLVGPRPQYLKEYAVLVGRSGKARKGTSWEHPEALFRAVDTTWADRRVVNGLSSGEGLIYAVRDSVETYDAKSGEMKVVDPGEADKRLMVVEGEFARVLKVMGRDGNSLSAVVRDAYDRDRLQNQTKNDPHRSTGAHVSIVGHITSEELLRHLNQTEQANGFANRFLFAVVRRSNILPFGGGKLENHEELVDELRASVEFGRSAGELTWGEESKLLWEEIYPDLSEGEEGLVGGILGRAETHVLRLAALYAVMDRSRTIEPPHLFAALSLWDYCEASVRLIFGNASGDRTLDTLVEALRNAGTGGMTRTEIHHLFSGHAKSHEIERALMTLLSQGRASRTFEDTGGRRIERWSFRR
jgi:Protein of unknown function (DUF3987)